MGIQKVSKDDHFGVFYVKKPDGRRWDSYYKTIDALRPLFKDEEFRKIVSGFYLNVYGVGPRDFDSVRISYFVDKTNSEKAISIFKKFFENNEIIEILDSKYPIEKPVAKNYGGEEFADRMRNFLVLYTQIGLELIKENLLHARRLFVTYRWQVRKASLPFKEHFEPTFKKYSLTYNSLSHDEKDQFFADLEAWPNPPQVDWAHMMVNFVLGCDWNWVFRDPNYLTPGEPLSISEINRILAQSDLDFQIPLDWKP